MRIINLVEIDGAPRVVKVVDKGRKMMVMNQGVIVDQHSFPEGFDLRTVAVDSGFVWQGHNFKMIK